MPPTDSELLDNLAAVRARIERAASVAGRAAAEIELLAVSKTKPADAIRVLHAAGQRAFGENYLQEALEKQADLADLQSDPATQIEWHYIGAIQSNKTRPLAEHFAWVHGVDRLKIAQRLSEQRPTSLPPLQVCLQLNISAEDSKSGVALDALPALAREVMQLPHLQLRGLMVLPAPEDDPAQQRAVFAQVRHALEGLNTELQPEPPFDTLSMGMSGDLEAAIAEGATIVRIGTDLFGARSSKAST
ncbi:MAG: YggS family pyridoxal phosphate-dependent enzyme [Gammaproteobacteria bacterium]